MQWISWSVESASVPWPDICEIKVQVNFSPAERITA